MSKENRNNNCHPGLGIRMVASAAEIKPYRQSAETNHRNSQKENKEISLLASEIIQKIPLNKSIFIKEKDPNTPGKDTKKKIEIIAKDDYCVSFRVDQSQELTLLEHRSFCQLTKLLTRNEKGMLEENTLLTELLY